MATKISGKQIDLTSFDTDDINEGSSNLYYTDARTRAAVSAGGDLSYASGTGVFSVTTYKSANFNSDLAAKDSDDLSEGTNNLYYTEARFSTSFGNKSTTDLSEGTNLYYTDARVQTALSGLGTQTIGANTSTITFGDDVVITGDLTVSGATTTINTSEINLEDNVIVINSGQTGTPATSLRSGIEVERGDSDNVFLQFNENDDAWEFSAWNPGTSSWNLVKLIAMEQFSAGTGLSFNNGEYSLANDGVQSQHIADGAINSSSMLADSVINHAKIADNAVRNSKIPFQKVGTSGVASPSSSSRTVTFSNRASTQANGIPDSADCFVFLNGVLLEDAANSSDIGTSGDYHLADSGSDKTCEIDHDLLSGTDDRIIIKYVATA